MTTFRGKPIKRGGGGFPLPPTHMADGSLKYPDGPPKSEPINYTEINDSPDKSDEYYREIPDSPDENGGYYTENPKPPKKKEEE